MSLVIKDGGMELSYIQKLQQENELLKANNMELLEKIEENNFVTQEAIATIYEEMLERNEQTDAMLSDILSEVKK